MSRDASVLRVARPAVVNGGRRVVHTWGLLTAPLRPPADFLVIGAKRSGTTSLYFQLLSHPQVVPLFPSPRLLPKANYTKGIHWFDHPMRSSWAAYRAHFPSRAVREIARLRSGRGRVVAGEAWPYYLFHPLAPELVAEHVPDVRLVALLRDPVERTFSHYREQVRNGVETLQFEEALDREQERLAGEEERLRRQPWSDSHAHEQQSYATQSEYHLSIARWLQLLPREHLHVAASEDYYRDPQAVLDGVVVHLGLSPAPIPSAAPRNAAPPAQMAPDTRERLRERFRPGVRRLESLLGQSFPWDV